MRKRRATRWDTYVPRLTQPHARIWKAYKEKYAKVAPKHTDLVKLLGTYVDLWDAHVALDTHDDLRTVLAMHAMSHVARTRQRVLKDNERLAKAAAAAKANEDDEELPELRDQGFTRPKVLLLTPFRNTAKAWVERLIQLSACEQIEQKSRFQSEFSLPPNVVDKLADERTADRYPADHRKTFRGNIDDNFKLGVKLTRKTLKLYSAFFESDVIVASPLGLRLLIEKERYVLWLTQRRGLPLVDRNAPRGPDGCDADAELGPRQGTSLG